ncbi:hypothetical protein K505DRAFT_2471 [Melanomma pulvis-pyrius CBS 109.77]|uniref:Uncharacterized protein n=1 Tax=Melanomma pulvis-pyrius CBS 109.77 TaxID=1314802 RepID=A0A6A6WP00_9PLEO|nr:hypothetical protein K505DRAFT_2471 [Melanomma pulvis-pyrius CBS 109.77]
MWQTVYWGRLGVDLQHRGIWHADAARRHSQRMDMRREAERLGPQGRMRAGKGEGAGEGAERGEEWVGREQRGVRKAQRGLAKGLRAEGSNAMHGDKWGAGMYYVLAGEGGCAGRWTAGPRGLEDALPRWQHRGSPRAAGCKGTMRESPL